MLGMFVVIHCYVQHDIYHKLLFQYEWLLGATYLQGNWLTQFDYLVGLKSIRMKYRSL